VVSSCDPAGSVIGLSRSAWSTPAAMFLGACLPSGHRGAGGERPGTVGWGYIPHRYRLATPGHRISLPGVGWAATMTARQLRSGSRWKRIRRMVLHGARLCGICGGPLRFDVPARHPLSPSVDHIRSLANGGEPFDRANLRATHYGCNSRRGTGLPAVPPVLRSTRW
jgi:hypothetical protein